MYVQDNYNVDDSSEALEICKQSILKPYFQFLKLVSNKQFL